MIATIGSLGFGGYDGIRSITARQSISDGLIHQKSLVMTSEPSTDKRIHLWQLRRCLLSRLYEAFQEFPYAVIELRQLEEECRVDTQTLNWNLVYLEKCGYIELGKSIESPPYIASSVSITVAGIDLVEDTTLLDNRFPSGSSPSVQSAEDNNAVDRLDDGSTRPGEQD